MGHKNPWRTVYYRENCSKSCRKGDLLTFAVHLGFDVESMQQAVMVKDTQLWLALFVVLAKLSFRVNDFLDALASEFLIMEENEQIFCGLITSF